MFELHYNIGCQIALNVVCVITTVHVCTIHSLVLYRVLCEVLWMALNVLISECWWLVWCVIYICSMGIFYPSLSVLRSALGPALAMVCDSPS